MEKACLVVGTPVSWSTTAVVGRSPSLLRQAIEGHLAQVHGIGPNLFALPEAPGWEAGLDPARNVLAIASPRNPHFLYGTDIDLSADWRRSAVRTGLIVLLVADGLTGPDRSRQLAAGGTLLGGTIRYSESALTADPPRERNHGSDSAQRLTIIHDAVGYLSELVEYAADGVMPLDEAKSRARRINWVNWVFDAEEFPTAQELTDEEILAQTLPDRPLMLERSYWEYLRARLVTEIADARGGPGGSGLWLPAAKHTIETASHVLSTTGDLSVFTEADQLSRQLIEFLRAAGSPGAPADMLVDALVGAAQLRVALLGPLGLGGDQYAQQDLSCAAAFWQWEVYRAFERGDASSRPDLLARIDEANELLEEALREAAGPLRRRALILRTQTGQVPARALPADRLLTLALAAWSTTGPEDGDPVSRLYLARLLHSARPDLPVDDATTLFSAPLERIFPRYGEAAVREMISQGIELARARNDRDMLRRVLRWSAQMPEPVSDAHARQEFEAQLHCLPHDPTTCPPPGVSTVLLAREYASRAGGWTAEQRQAALTHLAAHAREERETHIGLRVLPPADQSDGLGHSYWLLWADLHYQAARSGQAPQDYPDVNALLAHVAQRYSLLGLFGPARACLVRVLLHLVDDSEQPQSQLSEEFLQAVAADTQNIFPMRDPDLELVTRDVVHLAALEAIFNNARLSVQLALHHAAKGAQFARWHGMGKMWKLPDSVTYQMDRLRGAGLQSDSESPGNRDAGHEGGEFLAGISGDILSALSGREKTGGRTDWEIKRNLRRHIDQMINKALVDTHRSTPSAAPDWHRFRKMIDSRTVLLTWLLPAIPGFEDVCSVLAITQDDVEGALIQSVRESRIHAADDGSGDPLPHLLVDEVAAVRQHVTENPLFEHVTPEGARLLGRPHWFLDPEWLERWRQEGKDQLCLWPHGPLHYLPLHLYSYSAEGRLIADDFTVTTITSMGAFTGPNRTNTRPARTAVIAAADGGVPFGLQREEILERHAAKVAAQTGVTPIVGPDATKRRLLDELATADIVHIAAHGAQDPVAPWFHCVYLNAEGDDDGRVFAHDILTAGLRGVRMVTLASCESVLGRYDINDNLRGMPAALLLAGAQSLVGCLWPIHPAPATRFFGELHELVACGQDPKEAFRQAQLHTRADYPEYRHWGAFTFIRGHNPSVQEES